MNTIGTRLWHFWIVLSMSLLSGPAIGPGSLRAGDGEVADFRVVGWFGGGPGRYEKMTHLIPTFVRFNAEGEIADHDLRHVAAEAHAHSVKCLVAFDYDASPYPEMTDDDDGSRTTFVKNLLAYIRKNDLDGAHFDWEIGGGFPEVERNKFSLLVKDVHKAFEPYGFTVSIDGYFRHELNPTGIAHVDWIELMAYQDLEQGINMLDYWEKLGAPRKKLLLGMSAGWPDHGFNQKLAAAKTQYALDNGYGGMMLFRTDIDSKDDKSMLQAVYETAGEQIRATKLAKPTPPQAAWHDLELGMFIHFGIETWQDKETDDEPVMENVKLFNPANVDTDQWVSVAESFGAKYIILVAKHLGGFCLWQTDTTEYSVKNSPWKGGKGDVLRQLSNSCRRRGMHLGVYLSPADFRFKAVMGGGGRTADPKDQETYNRIYRRQLTEVLSRYGQMMEVWFDGSLIIEVGDILKKYAPQAMVFQGKYATIRWVGNEAGLAPYPAWNSLAWKDATTGTSTARNGNPDSAAWLANEVDTTSRCGYWFWNTTNEKDLKSLDKLMDTYYDSVGHGAVLLLNIAPDRSGRIPEADAKRAAEFGAEIRRRFGKSLAQTSGRGDQIELSLTEPTTIDHVVTMENIRGGERVREYVIEGLVGGSWQKLAEGTAIGHKKIDRFDPATVSKVRLRVTQSVATPLIRELAVYDTSSASKPSLSDENVKKNLKVP